MRGEKAERITLNKIISYCKADIQMVWETLNKKIPELKSQVDGILADITKGDA